jgi:hypothetical protein
MDADWSGRLLSWEWRGNQLEAGISRAWYFIRAHGREVLAWCELRELGGRRRVEVGSYPSVQAAREACERHAAGLLAERGERVPVDVRIKPARVARPLQRHLGRSAVDRERHCGRLPP